MIPHSFLPKQIKISSWKIISQYRLHKTPANKAFWSHESQQAKKQKHQKMPLLDINDKVFLNWWEI